MLGNGQKFRPLLRWESELGFRLLTGTRRHSTGMPEADSFCRPSTEEFGVRISQNLFDQVSHSALLFQAQAGKAGL
jgi:hypothetical protein